MDPMNPLFLNLYINEKQQSLLKIKKRKLITANLEGTSKQKVLKKTDLYSQILGDILIEKYYYLLSINNLLLVNLLQPIILIYKSTAGI